MTGKDIYRIALSFRTDGLESAKDLNNFSIEWINILLVESMNAENSIRESKNDLVKFPQLTTPQVIKTLDDVINYSDKIVMLCLPYGLASFLFAEDNNQDSAYDYRLRFVNSLDEYSKIKITYEEVY